MNRERKLALEPLETRTLFAVTTGAPAPPVAASQYSADGSGNNLTNPDWGSADSDLLRMARAAYGDGLSAPAGANRPSPRLISDVLADQADGDIISDRGLSAMVYAWGQFIDHDLDLTPPAAGGERFDIPVPAGDPSFDPSGTGTKTIPLTRSTFDSATGATTPRQQVNVVTAWLDGSMIYGSDAATQAALRAFAGGQLKMSADGLLPLNNAQNFPAGPLNMGNDAHRVPNDQLFAAGDVRANENIELTALQTLFVREHNYWAGRLAARNPNLTDEQLFQQARAHVIAEIQSITFNQWLPAVLGAGAVDRYTGYNPRVNPGIANEFSTAAFRFGHSLLGNDVEFLDNQGLPVRDEIELSEAFSNPDLVRSSSVGEILKYLASDPASELDNKVVESVRNFLFGPPGAGGLDLASLNIQRGRDHGLADYNSVRAAYGLPRVTSFAQITSDPEVQAKLQQLYGSVDNIDLWVGALAENHVPGASVGPTLRAIISDQFERLRDGDRFWYQRAFSGSELRELERTTLSDIIRRNTGVTNLQANLFFFKASVSGTVFNDANGDGRISRLDRAVAGLVVQLVNRESGEVVATARTNARGEYRFDVAAGLRTGEYQISVFKEGSTTPLATKQVAITRGDQSVSADLLTANSGNAGGGQNNDNHPRPRAPRTGPRADNGFRDPRNGLGGVRRR